MVQINVSQLLQAPIGSARSYKVDEIVDLADGNRPVRGEIQLMHSDRSILVKGRLDTAVELTCSRCLSLFSCPLSLDIEEEYFPTTDVLTGASLPPSSDEPSSFTIDEHNILDLTEAMRQCVLLVTPMKPLCGPQCAGLCPTCGANLNQSPCSCPPKPADPRWSKLMKSALNNQAR